MRALRLVVPIALGVLLLVLAVVVFGAPTATAQPTEAHLRAPVRTGG